MNDDKKHLLKRRLYKFIRYSLVFFVSFISLGVLSGHLSVTLTPSMKYRIWFIYAPPDNLMKDKYVVFRFKDPYGFITDTDRSTKRVACAPGDSLHVDNQLFFCNGHFIGRAKDFSLSGLKAPIFRYNGIIPSNKYFVMGDHPDSYDSRYFGFVDRQDILYEAKPIF